MDGLSSATSALYSRKRRELARVTSGRATFILVNVSVTGVPDGHAAEAQATIRRVLQPWAGNDHLAIVAHRLNSGEWSLMVLDGADLVMLKEGLADRLGRALRELPLG
jgi:hypothetical protein